MAATAKKITPPATPEAAAASVDAPIPVVDPKTILIDPGQHVRRIIARMPEGAVTDDVRNPKIWRKVQIGRVSALIKLDELLILAHDESWYARAIVAHATATEATLCIEKVGTFRAVQDQLFSDGKYQVAWNGHSYIVKRVSDGVVVDGAGYGTEALAIRAIERLYPTTVA